ncbi:hypothetical protein H9Y13_18995 [Aeromonas veronii]|nr:MULTISPECIES: hypothetical protein [Aeromonas]KAJ8740568.1 hypothetical protein H9Y13_18995 [Aeromonas veronii]
MFWGHLFKAIYSQKGAYALALGAVQARGIVPIEHFYTICGSPKAQQKKISAFSVLERMLDARIFVKDEVDGIGECVLTKDLYDRNELKELEIISVRARLLAEEIFIGAMKEWLRRLSIASFDCIKTRGDINSQPMVGPFFWDLSSPSYLAPLVDWNKQDKPNPGFVVCDVLFSKNVELIHIEPFLNKINSLQALKKINKVIYIFVALSYEKEALNKLKEKGVIPATPESLFGKDIAEAFISLIDITKKSAIGEIESKAFDEVITRLGSLEGAMGNMRGAFFEILVSHIIRNSTAGNVYLNRTFKNNGGEKAEVDVYVVPQVGEPRIIECKAMKPGSFVSNEEVNRWLDIRIKRVREHLQRLEITNKNGGIPNFELWTTGRLSDESIARIERTKEANIKKFNLLVFGPNEIRNVASSDDAALKILKEHFLPKA